MSLEKLYRAQSRFHTTAIVLCAYCSCLLLFRAKVTGTIYLFFMVWNLFLAAVPYAITLWLQFHPLLTKWLQIPALLIWLVFLPNSFYTVTDLVHLPKSQGAFFWLDLGILLSSAVMGFCFGLKSIDMIVKNKSIPQAVTHSICYIPALSLLCGFGLYIGRVQRFNSWDLLVHPFHFLQEIPELLTLKAVAFSLHFGIFIWLGCKAWQQTAFSK